jgi:hypothetical protein
VIETGEHPRPLTLRRHSTTYISRAVFVGLLPPEQILIHSYVKWLLR